MELKDKLQLLRKQNGYSQERVIGENFSGDFLKEVLMQVPANLPFRGPEIYTKGNYHYHCKVDSEFVWFQGYEVIFYMDEKIYECYFHGGTIR